MVADKEDFTSVGIEELDREHQELLSRFNALIRACDEGKGREEALRMLEYLNSSMLEHFTTEEALLQRYGFPDLERHQREHRKFIKDLTNLEHNFQEFGPIPRLVATTNQLVALWLIDHIWRMDAEFARFVAIARR
jgi:hemerythrin